MLDSIKVSVITPTYNDEKYIRQTINSILSQTHFNLEIIIIDDCSSDNTIDIVKSFDDNRVILVENKTNCGAAFSRNLGIKMATGDYIAFLDGDDLWAPEKIEKQLSFMINNGYDFSATEYYLIDEEGNKLNSFVSGPRKISNKMLRKISYIGCLTVMYKKSIFPDLAIPEDIRKRNDYALWLKLTERTDCYFLYEKLSFYRKRKSSMSSGSKLKLIKYHIKMYKSLYSYNNLKCTFFGFRNAFYYFFIKRKFTKKEKI